MNWSCQAYSIHYKIFYSTGVNPTGQRLYKGAREISGNDIIDRVGVVDGDVIHVVLSDVPWTRLDVRDAICHPKAMRNMIENGRIKPETIHLSWIHDYLVADLDLAFGTMLFVQGTVPEFQRLMQTCFQETIPLHCDMITSYMLFEDAPYPQKVILRKRTCEEPRGTTQIFIEAGLIIPKKGKHAISAENRQF